MKISGSNLSNLYSFKTKEIKNGKAQKSTFDSVLGSAAKDSVTISSGKNMSDDEFVSALRRKLSSEVRTGSSAQDINDIKQQIALGTYDINVNEIAKKILS